MPTPELETAERHSSDLLNQIIDHVHLTGRDYLMALDATRARDASVALRAKRELLEEIRTAANEFLVGKGLTISPCEAIGGAVQEAAIKYAEPAGRKEEEE